MTGEPTPDLPEGVREIPAGELRTRGGQVVGDVAEPVFRASTYKTKHHTRGKLKGNTQIWWSKLHSTTVLSTETVWVWDAL